jgi:hypothetical protein
MTHVRRIVATIATILVTGAGLAGAATAQPAPQEQDWRNNVTTSPYGTFNWPVLEQCWIDRFLPHDQAVVAAAARPASCTGQALMLACDWRIDYPSVYWIEQACGRVSSWSGSFGESWYGNGLYPEARVWVATVRSGGTP